MFPISPKIVRIFQVIALSGLVLFLGGCPIEPDEPPLVDLTGTQLDSETSHIGIEARLSAKDITQRIIDSLENPVATGSTEELNLKLLSQGSMTSTELVKELVRPYTPGYWETRYKKVKRRVEKSVKNCFKFKFKKCLEIVEIVVTEPFRVYVEPLEAIYVYVIDDITEIFDEVFDVGVWIRHKVYIESIDTSFGENLVNLHVSGHIEFDMDLEQNVLPSTWLGNAVQWKIKGLLNGDLGLDINVTGELVVNDGLELEIRLIESETDVKITKLFDGGLAVEAFDIVTHYDPLGKVIRKELADLLDKEFTKALQKELNDIQEDGDLNFGEELQELVAEYDQPYAVSDRLWLVPTVEAVNFSGFFGEDVGTSNYLRVAAEVEARPNFVYSQTPPDYTAPNNYPIRVKPDLVGGVTAYPTLSASYTAVQELAKSELNELIEQSFADKLVYVNRVDVYPSKDVIVMGVRIHGKSKDTLWGILYVQGVPSIDHKNSVVFLENIDFTIDTTNKFFESAAWALDRKILDELQEAVRFDFSDDLNELKKDISELETSTDYGYLRAEFPDVEIVDIAANNQEIVAVGKIVGTAIFSSESIEGNTASPDPLLSKSYENIVAELSLINERLNPWLDDFVPPEIPFPRDYFTSFSQLSDQDYFFANGISASDFSTLRDIELERIQSGVPGAATLNWSVESEEPTLLGSLTLDSEEELVFVRTNAPNRTGIIDLDIALARGEILNLDQEYAITNEEVVVSKFQISEVRELAARGLPTEHEANLVVVDGKIYNLNPVFDEDFESSTQ